MGPVQWEGAELETAALRVYAQIRDAIIGAEIQGGAPIREDEWARRLGVSRTPVREALRRLSAEGLVEVLPSRGARLVVWEDEDLEDLFRIRALIEGYGAELAAAAATDEDVQKLTELQERMEACARSKDQGRHELGRLDLDVHRGIVALSGSPRLVDVHERLSAVPTQFLAMRRYTKSQLRDRLKQHRDVLRAIEVGETEWAGAMMRAHVLSGWRLMLEQHDHIKQPSDGDAHDG